MVAPSSAASSGSETEQTFASYPSLAGRTALVTGGASGIGAAIVRAIAAQKAKVGFVDILEKEGETLAEELSGGGVSAHFLAVDLADISALQDAVTGISGALGTITVLVNNAANDMRHDWRGETPESWNARLAVNINHQFFAIQAVAPDMIDAGGGSIVNFGLISWRLGMGGMPAYTAAKAAVEALTRSFARDLGKHNIRVNAVLPGWVMTERQVRLWVDETTEMLLAERQALPGKLMPERVARLVLFLAAGDSAMCSLQNFIIDGGWCRRERRPGLRGFAPPSGLRGYVVARCCEGLGQGLVADLRVL
jgi:NAD(P)-dependent dehydrogenase (short-subunit alcohol dehydrogenase family)